ncbi:MAG: helix-turn-helix transcriptional regulator [Ginsengibacter sp.]
MELKDFLRTYRKKKKLSVRKFAEKLTVNKFRLEKWERGIMPNYDDGMKIQRYFGVKDFQNFSEEFLEKFEPKIELSEIDEVIRMKDLLIDEKEKRIQNLEETVWMLREVQLEYLKIKS